MMLKLYMRRQAVRVGVCEDEKRGTNEKGQPVYD